MIEGNIIKFGYGSILVCPYSFRSEIIFRHIKPPVEIGSNPIEGTYDVEKSVAFIFGGDMFKLIKDLKNIDEVNNMIQFRDHILDFTNYNDKSVNVVITALISLVETAMRALAC